MNMLLFIILFLHIVKQESESKNNKMSCILSAWVVPKTMVEDSSGQS